MGNIIKVGRRVSRIASAPDEMKKDISQRKFRDVWVISKYDDKEVTVHPIGDVTFSIIYSYEFVEKNFVFLYSKPADKPIDRKPEKWVTIEEIIRDEVYL